jgi:hypothetical protein
VHNKNREFIEVEVAAIYTSGADAAFSGLLDSPRICPGDSILLFKVEINWIHRLQVFMFSIYRSIYLHAFDSGPNVDEWLDKINQKLTELSGELQVVKAHMSGRPYIVDHEVYG